MLTCQVHKNRDKQIYEYHSKDDNSDINIPFFPKFETASPPDGNANGRRKSVAPATSDLPDFVPVHRDGHPRTQTVDFSYGARLDLERADIEIAFGPSGRPGRIFSLHGDIIDL